MTATHCTKNTHVGVRNAQGAEAAVGVLDHLGVDCGVELVLVVGLVQHHLGRALEHAEGLAGLVVQDRGARELVDGVEGDVLGGLEALLERFLRA